MTDEELYKIAPWMSRGRWYQALIENDAGTLKITSADEAINTATVADNTIILPAGFIMVDFKIAPHVVEDSAETYTVSFSAGAASVTIPTNIDYALLYFYGYFE